jgi:hypothetical protein
MRVSASDAERALERTDARVNSAIWQIRVAALTVRAKVEHHSLVAGTDVAGRLASETADCE